MTVAEKSQDRLTASRRARGTPDKFSFFVVFLIGTAGILSLRVNFGIWQGYVIAWSVAWMLIYLALVTMVRRFRLRPDQAGDNLYYLGFLYTLVSLSVALYFFADADAALEQIISNFGIALATTILGVALRVVLHQMREDPIDTEREARLNLAEAANRLRAQLDISVRDMNAFSRQIRQSIEETLHGIGERIIDLLETSGGQVAKAMTNASKEIDEALTNFSMHAKALNSASRRHLQATEKLIGQIESIEVPMDLIDRKIAPALEQIVELVDKRLAEIKNEAVEAQAAILSEQVVTVEDLRAKVGRQIEAFEEQLRVLRESGARNILESMQGLAERQNEAYDRIARHADDSLAALRQSRQAMEDEVKEARAVTREVMQQLSSMVRTLGEELSGSRPTRRE